MEQRTVALQPKPVATISVMEDDEYAREFDGLSVEEACKDPMHKDLIPDKIFLPI